MADAPSVLIVDRERFSSLIAKMPSTKHGTDTATDGIQAIKKLRMEVPSIMVVDQDIPGTGIRLAELIGMNAAYNAMPIILTSTTPSPDTIIRARNAGISTYLAKPFRPSELTMRIDGALAGPPPAPPAVEVEPLAEGEVPDDTEVEEEETEAGSGADISKRVRTIEGLPPFPATHAEIMKLAKSEDASGEDLAEQIQMDPSFVATVLKLANSSYYGFSKKTDSLVQAVTRLGMEEIANLVMSAQVFENLGGMDEGNGLDIKEFWKHSVGTAFVARAVAKKLQTEVEAAFLGGMLHDLGKIVLDRYFADFYVSVVELVQEESISIHQAERDVMGITHAEVGGQLAEEWKFPKNYLNSITYHHNPKNTRRHQRLVCVIHLSDVICRELGYGSGGDDNVPNIDESVMDRFTLGDRGIKILKEAAEEDLANADSFISGLAG